ncbi:hypothetical protein AeMF1_006513 [Aphanomyces euteiches]|nr:hypothetical protein AeMF1_006513 [Aphanomyces euteiches]KAH9134014.1 hypothetical protein AeRB84_020104 [Aphanomyces euteiches]KAH9182598.1 hypothetical protein AeNC1_015426 [Aphanomyces euteiches]
MCVRLIQQVWSWSCECGFCRRKRRYRPIAGPNNELSNSSYDTSTNGCTYNSSPRSYCHDRLAIDGASHHDKNTNDYSHDAKTHDDNQATDDHNVDQDTNVDGELSLNQVWEVRPPGLSRALYEESC